MSKISDLIESMCPNGVRFCKIGEVAEVGTGSSNGNESDDNGKFPFFVRSQTIKRKNTYEYDEEAIIIPGEGGIGEIFHYINGKYALHQRVYRIHFISNLIDSRFAYYYLSAYFKAFILRKAVSATVTSIRKPMIEQFPIPLPPLPVQQEIVRILDHFTELTAELTARRKQYAYYRDALLTFGGEVEYCALEKCCLILDNQREPVTKAMRDCGEFPYYGANGIQDYVSNYIFDGTFVLVGEDGSVVTEAGTPVVTWATGRIWVNNHAHIIQEREGVILRYLYHYLQTVNITKLVHGNIPKLTGKDFRNITIPIPPLFIQRKLVQTLDRFDALCNDLTSGLPAEIAARQKQYEYYRDKLLSFPERS